MENLIVILPSSGQNITLNTNSEKQIILDFPIDLAIISHDNNSGLTFSFNNGSTVVISNFYNTYNDENMPDFVIEGVAINAETFFSAFSESMSQEHEQVHPNGSFNEFKSDDLMYDTQDNYEVKTVDTGNYSKIFSETDNNVIFSEHKQNIQYNSESNDKVFDAIESDYSISSGTNESIISRASANRLLGNTGSNHSEVKNFDDTDTFWADNGFDLIVGGKDINLDTMLAHGDYIHAESIEMLITGKGAEVITSLDDLANIGITVDNGMAIHDSTWTKCTEAKMNDVNGIKYIHHDASGNATDIAIWVQQAMIASA